MKISFYYYSISRHPTKFLPRTLWAFGQKNLNPISTWWSWLQLCCFEVSTAQEPNNGFYIYCLWSTEKVARHANAKFTFQDFDDNGILKIYNLERLTLIGHSFEVLSPLCTEKNPTKVNIELVSAPYHCKETFKTILRSCKDLLRENDKTNLNYIDIRWITSVEYHAYSLDECYAKWFYSQKKWLMKEINLFHFRKRGFI
jgi:hypothetical protein